MSTWMGLAVPLNGEHVVRQLTAANAISVLQKVTGGTGDFVSYRDNSETVLFNIEADGDVNIAAGAYLNLSSAVTTAPSTGLTKGDIFLHFTQASTPQLGCCVSTAGQTIKYMTHFQSLTFGRVT